MYSTLPEIDPPMQNNPRPKGSCCLKSCLTTLGGVGAAGLALLATAILIYFILSAMGGVLIIADPLKAADAVVVLSGGKGERMEEAARLYRDKYANFLVLTETGTSLPEITGSYVNFLKNEAITMGVAMGSILITEEHATSTFEEAQAVRRLMEQHQLRTCIVVTDPYHTFRTRLIFREVFAGSELKVRVRPVRDHWYKSATWWLSPEGREATFIEYAKLVYYYLGNVK